ncbi:aldo/keto reductase [Paenibacillus filicis]|uniref:Aldo/keto reductase n=1 Tax=Paenibacillus gyeongsangnamensis TaxID=3388067 RepID=A0ABT4QKT5_9BACL|nr:aldo/keto reductase [Paenibacillus filicis]MCZ8517330.1 aldo/keto reductase [Paenibacillus filicis]
MKESEQILETRRLGISELQVGILGMGCWQFGGDSNSYWGFQSQRDVEEMIGAALDSGINYFDTAEMYNDGESERSLGLALKGRRSRAIIGTKIKTSNTKPKTLREQCEASLRRLQTDYIDLYMLHWPINYQSILHFSNDESLLADPPTLEEAFYTLDQLKQEGKIRHIGISNHGVEQMDEVKATGVKVIANELVYNLLCRAIESRILPYCTRHQMGVIGYMGLHQGILSGKYRKIDEIPLGRMRSRHFHHSRGEGSRHGEEGAEPELQEALNGIHQLAFDLGVSVSMLSLAWAFSNPNIAITICGARNVQQLNANIEAASFPISSEVRNQLDHITAPLLHKLGNNADYFENSKYSRIR